MNQPLVFQPLFYRDVEAALLPWAGCIADHQGWCTLGVGLPKIAVIRCDISS